MQKHASFIRRAFCPLVVFVSVLYLTTGCKIDDRPEYVSGYVKELKTEKVISGAKVYKVDCEGEVYGSINCWATDTMTTGADGAYRLPGNNGWVLASAPGYWHSEQLPVLYGNESNTDIILAPHAWLKIRLVNESGAYEFHGDYIYHIPGGQDSTFMIFAKGNQKYTYVFNAIREINELPVQDSAFFKVRVNNEPINVLKNEVTFWVTPYLPGHDTTNLVITY